MLRPVIVFWWVLLFLLVSSTRVLGQNRVWSWLHVGPALADTRASR